MVVCFKSIKNVAKEGIVYIDEHEIERFLNFKDCYENWVNFKRKHENLNEEQNITLKNSCKYVGQRDICANPSYIEFFTKPFTRFIFDEDSKGEFKELQNLIINNGWTTLDLS
jgi:hypothetical protein